MELNKCTLAHLFRTKRRLSKRIKIIKDKLKIKSLPKTNIQGDLYPPKGKKRKKSHPLSPFKNPSRPQSSKPF